jgi:hypothetical protein
MLKLTFSLDNRVRAQPFFFKTRGSVLTFDSFKII